MRKILVCQHVPFEILGTLNPLLREAGFKIKYVNFGRSPNAKVDNLSAYHGLVILGGPMNVDQVEEHPHIETEIQMVNKAIALNIPILGICLGAQIVAKALGAEVAANPEKEIGWYDVSLTEEGKEDQVLSCIKDTRKIMQWHGDTFEIPKGAVHLASSPTCKHQAFRFRKKVYGLQFHLEVDEAMIMRWLKVNIYKEELEQLKGKIDAKQIETDTRAFIDGSMELSNEVFAGFIKLFGPPDKKMRLGSAH